MGSKQKYKVFINDKRLLFGHAEGCMELPAELKTKKWPAYMVDHGGVRGCFSAAGKNEDAAFNDFINHFRIVHAAGGLVSDGEIPGNRYLMIFRMGKWDLPKGKLDPGETPEVAAIREIGEECGINQLRITGPLPDTWHMYRVRDEWMLKKTSWFRMVTADTRTPVPATEEGIEQVTWVNGNELVKLLPRAHASIADLLSELFSGS